MAPLADQSLLPPTGQVSVRFKSSPGIAELQSIQHLYGSLTIRQNPDTFVSTLKVPAGLTAADFAHTLSQDPKVEWAEPVRWQRLLDVPKAPLVPNDTNYAAFQQWYYDAMSLPDAWSVETGKPSVVIAVLDSGVLCTHPDLQSNIYVNPTEIAGNGVDDDANGFVDDVNGFDFVGSETGANPDSSPDLPGDSDPCFKPGDPGLGNGINDDGDQGADGQVSHGTLVSGVIAGIGNNGVGIAGMCWSCKIMPVRIANPEGWVRDSDTNDAITYAARAGAKIINLSLGGDFSQALQAAVNVAVNTYGALLVAAAGNENQTPIHYPARFSNVIGVGASSHGNTKGRAHFSNWGTGVGNNRAVDVVAPGIDIFSTKVVSVGEANSSQPAGSARYESANGTSFSTPLVVGLAGLILSRNPALTWDQVRTIIKNSATALPNDPTDTPDAGANWAGSGMINAAAAMTLAGQGLSTTPTPTPTRTPTPTPTATPVPGPAPTLTNPTTGSVLTTMGTNLTWTLPAGATQYQIQVTPANNDGPAINLIRNAGTLYMVEQPVFGTGPYVMLPGITYTWRVRSTNATTGIDENSPLWGSWSPGFTFKTRTATSAGITVVAPASGATGIASTPTLQWLNNDQNVFYYEVQLSKDPNFGEKGAIAMVYSELRHAGVTTPPSSYTVPAGFPLEPATTYFWRVRPRIQGDGTPVTWPASFTFTTQ